MAADMRGLDLPDESFDAVLSVFGVFFVPDMEALTRELWALVKPGGRLVIAVWAPGLMAPATPAFWDAVRNERPDLVTDSPGWQRVSDPDDFRAMLCAAGIPDRSIEIDTVPGLHPLSAPEDYWTIVMGAGLRGTVEQLDSAAVERVRAHVLGVLRDGGVTALPIDAHLARATKSTDRT
jgi:SAM-dependent methyltransferase